MITALLVLVVIGLAIMAARRLDARTPAQWHRKERALLASQHCPACNAAYGTAVADAAFEAALETSRMLNAERRGFIIHVRQWPVRCRHCGSAARFSPDHRTVALEQN